MFTPDQYELLDFGDGRRLERFGRLVVDRPCPVAEGQPMADPARWPEAEARFRRADQANSGQDDPAGWDAPADLPDRWMVAWDRLSFELKRAPQGQVGLFPEQADNWRWIGRQLEPDVVANKASMSDSPPRILNLFAYTGGSTLAAAAAGAAVTHVDAAKNVVAWARRNAAHSGLADAPVRWITEDARKFVKRELRRGSRYEGVILDPPSYGHGRRGEVWRLSKHLPQLLRMCAELTEGRRRLILLTCHTPGYEAARLRRMLAEALGVPSRDVGCEELSITASDGRQLPSGSAAHWPG